MSFQDKLNALPLKPMTAGEAAHFEHPPCFRCGYNSDDYYQTAHHRCAQAYHAFKNSDDYWLYARLELARELLTVLGNDCDCLTHASAGPHDEALALIAKLDGER